MGEPGIPTSDENDLTLPCGHIAGLDTFDMGMRVYQCDCGQSHAVVMDVHPLGRWIPESVVRVLEETIEPLDEFDEFSTIHLMGIVIEEFPDAVVIHDASSDPSVGWALLWVTEFDSRQLHEVIVELLVELMDHAISHTDDREIQTSFAELLDSFDIATFVEEYRSMRDFDDQYDRAM